jgi:hypothetical protein
MAEAELVGAEEDWPVLSKAEWEETQSAVCLKRTKMGYVLGVSCDQAEAFRAFYSESHEAISTLAERFEAEMRNSGNPLSGAVVV